VMTMGNVSTVNVLGRPDNGVIACGYLGALLVAGAFLAVGSALSAATKNQVIAFVLAVAVCFVFAVASYSLVTDFLGTHSPALSEIALRIGVLDRFQDFTRGIISLRDIIYFASFIGFFLFLNTVILEQRRAD
jgi:ABC-2 type transport system permease protein